MSANARWSGSVLWIVSMGMIGTIVILAAVGITLAQQSKSGTDSVAAGSAGDSSAADSVQAFAEFSLAHRFEGDFPAPVLVNPATHPAGFDDCVAELRRRLKSKPTDRLARVEILGGGRIRVHGNAATLAKANRFVQEAPPTGRRIWVQRVDLSAAEAGELGLDGDFKVKSLSKKAWQRLEGGAAGSSGPAVRDHPVHSIAKFWLRLEQRSNVRYDLSSRATPLEPLVAVEFKVSENEGRPNTFEWETVVAHPHAKYKLSPTTSKPRWQSVDRRQGRIGLTAKPGQTSRIAIQGARHADGAVTVLCVDLTQPRGAAGADD